MYGSDGPVDDSGGPGGGSGGPGGGSGGPGRFETLISYEAFSYKGWGGVVGGNATSGHPASVSGGPGRDSHGSWLFR